MEKEKKIETWYPDRTTNYNKKVKKILHMSYATHVRKGIS